MMPPSTSRPRSHSHPHSRSRDRGFTRTDLLATILPLALLVALTLPLAGNSRVQSRLATCLDNHRRLALAWQMYAGDNAEWFPPNNDDGSTTPGFAWVPGQAGPGGAQEFDRRLIADPRSSLLLPYLQLDATLFRCPADTRSGLDRTALSAAGRTEIIPAARSVAMNGAVGTNPHANGGKQAADGPWLDNNHAHTYGRSWLTYGREPHLTRPGPSRTALILDEDDRSINDAYFSFGMQVSEWIDWPATWHNGAGVLSFADAHVEAHLWVDSRTTVGTSVIRRNVPGSPDYLWLRERISASIPR